MKKSSPIVSIVINSFKNINKLCDCINSIKRSKYENIEIIVVCFGIKRNKFEENNLIEKIDKLILMEEDLGPPAQRNIGYNSRSDASKYVLFLDDDVRINDDLVKKFVNLFENNSKLGIAQPILINKNNIIDCAGVLVDNLGYSYSLYKNYSRNNVKFFCEYYYVTYVATACIFVRVSDFYYSKNLTLFDDKFYFNYEDADFCMRAWLKGVKSVCVTNIFALHERGRTSSLAKSPSYLIYLNTRNKLLTLFSIYSIINLLIYIPLFLIFEISKSIYTLKYDSLHSIANFKALFWGLRHFSCLINRRKIVRKNIIIDIKYKFLIRPRFYILIKSYKTHYNIKKRD